MHRVALAGNVRRELTRMRDSGPKPYLRERAAAILKIAAGISPARVARHGLLRARRPETVRRWLVRFRRHGMDGLKITPGAGRKPAFGKKEPPSCSEEAEQGQQPETAQVQPEQPGEAEQGQQPETARAQPEQPGEDPHPAGREPQPVMPEPQRVKQDLLDVIRRDPHLCGFDRARWSLVDLLRHCRELGIVDLTTTSGLSRMLDRLDISYQRGRDYVHSPDPDYPGKRDYLNSLMADARASAGEHVFLFLDELTYYRQPTLACAYEERGCQPLARRSWGSNADTRVLGALNIVDGRVHYWQGTVVSVPRLVRFFGELHDAYPEATRISIGMDNWPVHFHPDVLVALEPQRSPWPIYRPANWPTEPSKDATRKWGHLYLPIQLVPLPTYASWLNPIEKLWRKGKQEVLHLHRLADLLDELRQRFDQFLSEFARGSMELLRYVGLALAAA